MSHDPHDVEQSYEQGAHGEHYGGVGIYVAVAVCLVFLTACSYWTYTPFWPFGDNIAVKRLWMMAVSCTKAMLVILFFMHLKWEANLKYVLTIPASMMSIFLLLMLVPDVGRRTRTYTDERWLHAAEEHADDHAHEEGFGLYEQSHDEMHNSGKAHQH
jgi:cytochrome c oxidase subunit 4